MKQSCTWVVTVALLLAGCGGAESQQVGGSSGGGSSSGGASSSSSSGGSSSSSGGSSSSSGGGSSSGGASSSSSSGGSSSSSGGSSSSSGGSSSSSGGNTGDVDASEGCGKKLTRQNKSTIAIESAGLSRKYILWIPDNYDESHPYRLVVAYHWYTGSAQQVVDCTTEGIRCYTTQSPFFGLWNLSNSSTIFVAPDGIDAGWANTNGRDLAFTDDLLKQVEAELCIDRSRIFANGFSYGGAMSAVLACARPKVFRAVAVYAGGLGLSDPTRSCSGEAVPVAYFASHGTGDSGFNGGQKARDYFVQANGCTPQAAANPPAGGHACTSYQGCSSGHPVRWCAFDGGHSPSPVDRGGSATWNPQEVWTFFGQF